MAVVVLVGLGLGIAWASTRPTQDSYRTAIATMGSVSQSVSASGSLADLNRATAAFASAGSVAAIKVHVGDTVRAGQTLGTLDTTDLDSAVSDATTNLSDAKQTLQDDKESQASAAAGSSSAATSATTSTADAGIGQGAGNGAGSVGNGGSGAQSDQRSQQSPTTAPPSSPSGSGAPVPNGTSGTSGNLNQAKVQQAQDAIVGCRQLLDYLIGQGMTTGTCDAAPATGSRSSGPAQPSTTGDQHRPGSQDPGGARNPGGAQNPADTQGVASGQNPATSTAAVPVSQGCKVILSATDSGGTTVTVTSGSTTTLTTTVTPTPESTSPTVSDSGVTTTTTSGPETVTQTTTEPTTIYVTVPLTTVIETDSRTVTESAPTTTESSDGDGSAPSADSLRGVVGAALAPDPDPYSGPSASAGQTNESSSSPIEPPTGGATSTTGQSGASTVVNSAGTLHHAVADCQSAITTAVDALNNLYSWEIVLDDLLQSGSTGGSGTATTGAPHGTGVTSFPQGGAASTGSGPQAGNGSHSGVGSQTGMGSQNGRATQLGSGGSGAPATSIIQADGAGGSGDRAAATGAVGGGSGLSGANGSNASGGSDRVPTAADLSSDQAQIDLMETKLAIAHQNLKGATLTSPIDGTVAKVAIAKGDSVTAASTSQVITIVGRSQYQIQVSIPLTEIELIKTGQRVSVSVNGTTEKLPGSVSMIGVLDDSSTSTPSYPVTVVLERAKQTLFDGMGASLIINVGAADDVLTVPSSAVSTAGSRHTVTVLEGGKTSVVTVGIGLVGPVRTQITSGLKAGQVVVLANVDEPLPTSSANAGFGRPGSGGLGGLGGGAAPAGGPEFRFGR